MPNCEAIETDGDGKLGCIGADDIPEANIDFSTECGPGNHYYLNGNDLACEADDDTTYTGGRSVTENGGAFDADPELYTDTKCIWFENPTAADDFKSIWRNDIGKICTVTKLWCESDQTVTCMLQVDDGSPSDMDSVDLICNIGEDTDVFLNGDYSIQSTDEVDLVVTSVSGTPTWVSICFTFTIGD